MEQMILIMRYINVKMYMKKKKNPRKCKILP